MAKSKAKKKVTKRRAKMTTKPKHDDDDEREVKRPDPKPAEKAEPAKPDPMGTPPDTKPALPGDEAA
jgi:hypothetical protein